MTLYEFERGVKAFFELLAWVIIEEIKERWRLFVGDTPRYHPHSRLVPFRAYEAAERRLYVPTWRPGQPRPAGRDVAFELYYEAHRRRGRALTARERSLIKIPS